MVSLENFLASQRDYNQNMAQQNARSQAGMVNPLSVALNAAIGFISSGGNPMGAVAGALKGASASNASSVAEIAPLALSSFDYGKSLADEESQKKAMESFLQPNKGVLSPAPTSRNYGVKNFGKELSPTMGVQSKNIGLSQSPLATTPLSLSSQTAQAQLPSVSSVPKTLDERMQSISGMSPENQKTILTKYADNLFKEKEAPMTKYQQARIGIELSKLGKPDATTDFKKFTLANQLRSQFLSQSKDYQAIRDSYGRLAEGAANPSAAGDIAMVFNYMKMLDPSSVVRESEYATAANAAGIPERVRNQYNKALSGQSLTPAQRNDFIKTASNLFNVQSKQHEKRVKEYDTLSSKYGLDPSLVTLDVTPPVQVSPTIEKREAPIGTVIKINGKKQIKTKEGFVDYNG